MVQPIRSGMLAVGDGHEIYWETIGNPRGVPLVYLHGGPGGGASEGIRSWFDPERYNYVIFDQRGCGRSRPLAERDDVDLSLNTTHHLVSDIEALREMLEIESWYVLGLSWGTTLGFAYAQQHRERVRGLVLGSVTTTTPWEVSWITEGVGAIFPEAWHQFATHVPIPLRNRPLVDAYAELLMDEDMAVVESAAREWCRWEDTHVSLAPGHQPHPSFNDPAFRIRFARLVTHYWRNSAFYEGESLLEGTAQLSGIPGVLIHGRYDVSAPLVTPWRISKMWDTSELVVMDGGHSDAKLPDLVAAAMDSMT